MQRPTISRIFICLVDHSSSAPSWTQSRATANRISGLPPLKRGEFNWDSAPPCYRLIGREVGLSKNAAADIVKRRRGNPTQIA
jgi:hypothetical protein